MPVQLNRNLAITLLFSLLVLLALAPPSSANGLSPDVLHRRDHANLNRMIKKRAPYALIPRQGPRPQTGAVGAAADPSTNVISSSAPSSTPVASAPSGTSQTPATPLSIQSPVSPVLSSATPTSASSQSSVSPTSSATSTSTSASLTTPTSSPPSTSGNSTPATQANKQLPASSQSPSVDSVTLTSHVPAASSSSADSSQIGGSSLSHSAITILIVIAASIGGCVIIWTVIRKWKFRPSAQFEDRLEPVNWQPTEHDSGLPTLGRMPSNASSFHSAGHDNMAGLSQGDSGAGAGYNAGRSLTPIPDHDFTAGAANLAPVGGYADLARGPSPQPQMHEALQYGPSINLGYENYGGNGVQEAHGQNDTGARY